ncbi:putative ribonuclease H-like domain-containing protein [Tanacetum coccineum]
MSEPMPSIPTQSTFTYPNPNSSASPSFTQDDTSDSFIPEPTQPIPAFTQPAFSQPAFSQPNQSIFSQPAVHFQQTQPTQTNQTGQQYPNNVQSQQFQQFQTASISANNAKFPYLEKDKYEIWAMKMEYWIQNADHNLWRIVQQGNSPKRLGKDAKGNTIVHPPVSLDEHVAVQRENKVRTLLLQALPEDHMPDFHHYDDARDIWMAVKARFGGNEESKKMRKTMLKQQFTEFSVTEEEGLHKGYDRFQKILSQLNQVQARPDNDDINLKFLRALPSSWSQVALALKTRGGLDSMSFDDLYNKLRSLELDVRIGHSYGVKVAAAPTHSAFIGTACSGSKPTYSDQQRIVPSVSQTSGRSDNVMECVLHSFVAENEQDQDMIYEDFDQVDQLEMEELDLKWQMAMLSLRINRFEKKAGRKMNYNNQQPARFDRRKVRCYKCLQLGHFARECNVKTVDDKARYSAFKVTEVKTDEPKALVSVDSMVNWSDHAAENTTGAVEKVYGMMAGLHADSADASDAAAEFAMMGISPKVQNCPLGCDSKINDLNHMYNNLDRLYNDCYIKVQAYQHAVKTLESQKDWYHKTQIALEEKIRVLSANLENTTNTLSYTEKLHDQAQKEKKEWEVKFEATLARFEKWKESSKNLKNLIDSSMSTRTKVGLGFQEYFGVDEVFDLSTPSVFYSDPVEKEVKPLYSTFVKAGEMHAVPPPITGTYMPSPYQSDIEETQVSYGSKSDNNISDTISESNDFVSCDNSDKSSDSETHASCDSSLKTQTKDIPPAVDIQTLPESDVEDPNSTTGSPSFSCSENVKSPRIICNKSGVNNRKARTVSAGRPVSAGWLNPAARPFFRPSSVYNTNWPNIYDPMIKGRWGTAGDPSTDNDIGIVDSGCSRSMTGNKEKLDDFVQVKGGIVKFGGGDGRISGKGTIRTSKLDFENVYYVEELQHFNLFSVSQICDKKNKVLFTDTDCLVLTEDFQLPDESQVVLRIPRKCDLYTFSISELQPEQNVTCLVAKASLDESTRWHRRMAHVNFKTINKLAKEGLVDGLPLKVFTNEHNCVACNKGKQHKASYKHISAVRLITETLQLLHMDLFGPTNIRSIDQKYYSLVVTDDFSRFTWTFYLGHLKPFGCQVTILNTSDHLEKYEGKADEGYLVGYAPNSKAYRVYNLSNKRVEETLNLRFLEDKPNVQGIGHEWAILLSVHLFADFIPVHADESTLPSGQSLGSSENNTRFPVPSDVCKDQLSSGIFTFFFMDDDFRFLVNLASPVLTRSRAQKSKFGESAFIGYIQDQQRTNHTDQLHCLFACFLSQLEPTSIAKALEDPDWVAAMQEEMQQFINQKVWKLVPLPDGKNAIGTKWILKNKRDARGIVVRNKARLVAQGHRQEEGIDYDEMDVKKVVKALYGLHQAPRAVIEIFKYLKGQPKLGLWYPKDSDFQLEAYSDSDYAGSHGDRKSTTEAEYVAFELLSCCCTETYGICKKPSLESEDNGILRLGITLERDANEKNLITGHEDFTQMIMWPITAKDLHGHDLSIWWIWCFVGYYFLVIAGSQYAALVVTFLTCDKWHSSAVWIHFYDREVFMLVCMVSADGLTIFAWLNTFMLMELVYAVEYTLFIVTCLCCLHLVSLCSVCIVGGWSLPLVSAYFDYFMLAIAAAGNDAAGGDDAANEDNAAANEAVDDTTHGGFHVESTLFRPDDDFPRPKQADAAVLGQRTLLLTNGLYAKLGQGFRGRIDSLETSWKLEKTVKQLRETRLVVEASAAEGDVDIQDDIDLDGLSRMASTALGHDQPAGPSEDVEEEKEEEEVPLRETSLNADLDYLLKFSCRGFMSQARNAFVEDTRTSDSGWFKRLRAEDLAQEVLPNVSEERAKELDDLMMRMTETDWLNLMLQVGSNPALARELLGADVNEENFIERMTAVKEKKKRALADLRYRALKGKPMKKSEVTQMMRNLVKNQWCAAHNGTITMKDVKAMNPQQLPAITEPPSKRQRVSSQPASVPAATTLPADDPDSAGGGSSNPAGSATPVALRSSASNLLVDLHGPMYLLIKYQFDVCLNPNQGVLMKFFLEIERKEQLDVQAGLRQALSVIATAPIAFAAQQMVFQLTHANNKKESGSPLRLALVCTQIRCWLPETGSCCYLDVAIHLFLLVHRVHCCFIDAAVLDVLRLSISA